MGVHGLWKLLEPSGKPVTLESLENKVLAIDVSMWLHQVMKGYQDSTGNALPNAHLLGLFHRICKLQYYRIKPVFVFDGGVPQLKQQTLASRRQMRGQATKKAERERLKLLRNLMEQGVVRQALVGNKRPVISQASNKPSPYADFILEPMPAAEFEESESEVEELISDDECQPVINWDNFDPDATSFKKLPVQERIEILTDLKEARKQNSWGRIHEMPQESNDFSGFQLRRLLVRRSAQVGLEEAEKELGERHTLTMTQLHEMMEERGSLAETLSEMQNDAGRRIVSDTTTRFLLINKPTPQLSLPAVQEETSEVTEEEIQEGDEMVVKRLKTKTVDTIDLESGIFEEEKEEDFELISIKSQIENESELTQAEILAMIKTTSNTKIKTKQIDPNMPSTSSSGNYEPVEVEPENSNVDLSKIRMNNSILQSPLTKIYGREVEMQKAIESVLGSKNKSSPTKVETVKKYLKFEDKTNLESEIKTTPEIKLPQTISKDLKKALALIGVEIPNTIQTEPVKKNSINILSKQEEAIVETTKLKSIEKPLHLQSKSLSNESLKEVQIPKKEETKPKNVFKTPVVQITIDPDVIKKSQLKPEDDIFADIFDTEEDEIENEDNVHEISDSEESVESEKEVSIIPATSAAPAPTLAASSNKETKTAEKEIRPNSTPPIAIVEDTLVPEEIAPRISNEELIVLEENLVQEQANLASEVGRQERLAVSISDQMCMEAQELLRLFGLPYIIAPMEAEAQCAILDLLSLTQGTVTDDSDIWLFGGKTVYRNFFNQSRSVEVYTADAIQKCFKLSRGQLVLLALLVGSDYTMGLAGVGPVTALEILSAFSSATPSNQQVGVISEQPEDLVAPLRSFREWWAERQAVHNARMRKLRSKLKDLNIHEGFPSTAVVEAYIHPEVDDSREKFSWGKPDIPAVIHYAREKFGWTKSHAESILNPVVKRLNDTSVQQRLDSFFSVIPQVSNAKEKMSSRVRQAVNQMGMNSESDEEPNSEKNTVNKKRGAPKRQAKNQAPTDKEESAQSEDQESIPQIPSGSRIATAAATKRVVQPVRTSEGRPNLTTLQAMRKALTKKPKPKRIPLPSLSQDSQPSTSVPIKKPIVAPGQELILQKIKDKESALQNKLKAIELFRKRKLDSTPKNKKKKQVIKDDHYLSESSSDD